jgi:hypothetical protein
MDVNQKSSESENIFQLIGKVTGFMSLALERKKASKVQMRMWARMLREAADKLERLSQ